MPSLAAALADFVLPRYCVACGRPGQALCAGCVPAGLVRLHAAGLPVVAAAPYAGAVRTALIAYKERGRRDLAAALAELLARAVAGAPGGVLVPVPCAGRVARARGGDHVLRLALLAGGPVAAPLLLTRGVHDSAGLGSRERAANLHGAMTAEPPARPGTPALVVDDIVTTGATLREAARALESAGWTAPGAAVVAATARRRLARPGRAV
jgi:predicted amidophosphoribosyltransferase